MNSRQNPRSVPYEILRRSDGMLALSITLGHLGFKPSQMLANEHGSLLVNDESLINVAIFNLLPKDVLNWILEKNHIRLYEFSSQGDIFGHDLHTVCATPKVLV